MTNESTDYADENWKPVPGFEGSYEISDMGRVRGIRRQRVKGGLMKLHLKSDYQFVSLGDGKGRKHQFLVHRLVLMTFVGDCPEGMETAHNNGNKLDNRLVNLRWATKKENAKDRELHGNHPRVVALRRNRLSASDVACIRQQYRKTHQDELAAMFGVCRSTIQRIHRGQRHSEASQ